MNEQSKKDLMFLGFEDCFPEDYYEKKSKHNKDLSIRVTEDKTFIVYKDRVIGQCPFNNTVLLTFIHLYIDGINSLFDFGIVTRLFDICFYEDEGKYRILGYVGDEVVTLKGVKTNDYNISFDMTSYGKGTMNTLDVLLFLTEKYGFRFKLRYEF